MCQTMYWIGVATRQEEDRVTNLILSLINTPTLSPVLPESYEHGIATRLEHD